MKGYIEWLNENKLFERALNVGAKSAMPKENQAVILAGGAGSGKGMVLNNILNIPNARVFDVDKLRMTSSRCVQSPWPMHFSSRLGKT